MDGRLVEEAARAEDEQQGDEAAKTIIRYPEKIRADSRSPMSIPTPIRGPKAVPSPPMSP